MTWVVCAATCSRDFLARDSGSARAASTDTGSSGQSGASATYPASSKSVAQRSQLDGSSHRPWMKTTGGAVGACARSTCSSSRAVMVAGALPSTAAWTCGIVVIKTSLHGRQRGGRLAEPRVERQLAAGGTLFWDQRVFIHRDA